MYLDKFSLSTNLAATLFCVGILLFFIVFVKKMFKPILTIDKSSNTFCVGVLVGFFYIIFLTNSHYRLLYQHFCVCVLFLFKKYLFLFLTISHYRLI